MSQHCFLSPLRLQNKTFLSSMQWTCGCNNRHRKINIKLLLFVGYIYIKPYLILFFFFLIFIQWLTSFRFFIFNPAFTSQRRGRVCVPVFFFKAGIRMSLVIPLNMEENCALVTPSSSPCGPSLLCASFRLVPPWSRDSLSIPGMYRQL